MDSMEALLRGRSSVWRWGRVSYYGKEQSNHFYVVGSLDVNTEQVSNIIVISVIHKKKCYMPVLGPRIFRDNGKRTESAECTL